MIDVNRANSASTKIAQAKASLVKFQESGNLEGSRSKQLSGSEASDTFLWAQQRMESLVAIDSGKDSNYRDSDSKSGSIQSNFYHKQVDANFEGDWRGAFRFSEVRHDEDLMFGTPNTTTTVVECEM